MRKRRYDPQQRFLSRPLYEDARWLMTVSHKQAQDKERHVHQHHASSRDNILALARGQQSMQSYMLHDNWLTSQTMMTGGLHQHHVIHEKACPEKVQFMHSQMWPCTSTWGAFFPKQTAAHALLQFFLCTQDLTENVLQMLVGYV